MKPRAAWCKTHATEFDSFGRCPLCPRKVEASENDRWWQAFCAILASGDPGSTRDAAKSADIAVEEAVKRGRL